MSTKDSYSSVKCTLGSVLKDKKLREIIDKRVFFVSDLLHRGSHSMLLVVQHYYEKDIDLPLIKSGKGSTTFLRHCMHPYHTNKDGTWEQKEAPAEVLETVVDTLQWNTISAKESIVGYGRHLQLQADMYATNLQNHVLNLWKFVDYTIKTFCQRNGFPFTHDSDLVDELRNAIKDPDHVITIDSVEENEWIIVMDSAVCQSFISYHHDHFKKKDMDMKSIETIPVEKIILYFVHLLKYQHLHDSQDNPVKLFYPVPIHSVKRLSMTIDPEILYHMLNELGDEEIRTNSINRDDFANGANAPYKYFFEKYFDFKQFESKETERKNFNYSRGITTNGVKLSFLYNISAEVEAGPSHQRKSSQRYLLGVFF